MESRLIFFLQRLLRYIDNILITDINNQLYIITPDEITKMINFIQSKDKIPFFIDKDQRKFAFAINNYVWIYTSCNDFCNINISNLKIIWEFITLKDKKFKFNKNLTILHKQ
jgi:hypothetical protein